MKNLTRFLRPIILFLLLVGLGACSKKSEDVLPGGTHDARMEGTWRLASVTATAKEKGKPAQTSTQHASSPIYYEYRSDGTWANMTSGNASGRYTSETGKPYLTNNGQRGVIAFDIQSLTQNDFRYGASTVESFVALSRSMGAEPPKAEDLAKIESLTFSIALTKTSNTTTPGKR